MNIKLKSCDEVYLLYSIGFPKMHTLYELRNEYTGKETQESNSKEKTLKFWTQRSERLESEALGPVSNFSKLWVRIYSPVSFEEALELGQQTFSVKGHCLSQLGLA